MYEWDEAKRAGNLAKHGVDFAGMDEFDWSGAIVIPDTLHAYGETRFRAAGLIGQRLHMVVFTPRNGRLRIVSLRKANRRERERWASY
jgi:uncharacterized DUF497 family protein